MDFLTRINYVLQDQFQEQVRHEQNNMRWIGCERSRIGDLSGRVLKESRRRITRLCRTREHASGEEYAEVRVD